MPRGAGRVGLAQVPGMARRSVGGGGVMSVAAAPRRASHLVLGIEASCDDTSVAVLEDGRTLRSHWIAAQDLHQLYGGVVPELAARAHLELLPALAERSLADAHIHATELTGVAVTRAPGLVGSL